MHSQLNEIDAMADGQYHYRPVRHHFGITSFGATAWTGAAPGDPIINEYDEGSEPAEELFVVATGRSSRSRASRSRRLGARLRDAIAANPQYPMLVYNLACSESLRGHAADAIDHLRTAVGASEKLRADAREDSDFAAIRDEPSFRALIGE